MPTERFYNLSKGKKQVILDAITEEFTRVTFDKVSINKIIKMAGISRGSFYTYFKNKEDVLGYLFEEGYEQFQSGWAACAKANHGNLWKTSEMILQYVMDNTKENVLQLVKNVMESGKLFEKSEQDEDYRVNLQKALYDAIDMTGFKDDSVDTFGMLITMIFFAIAHCMGWYYHHQEDKEKIKKLFRNKLEILQYGICKQEVE